MKLTSTHYFIIAAIIVLVGIIGYRYYESVQPGQYDTFAQCLTDSGSTFFGAFWCPHCNDQKELFGNSVDLLPYFECSLPNQTQNEACNAEGITTYPTWEFPDGSRQAGVLSLETLAERSGCELVKDEG